MPTSAKHFIYVCASCDTNPEAADTPAAKTGLAMLAAVRSAVAQAGLAEQASVKSVRCMGGCERPCSVAFSAPAKQGCLFVGMTPKRPEEVIQLLRAYMAHPRGRIRCRNQLAGLADNFLARIPAPMTTQQIQQS